MDVTSFGIDHNRLLPGIYVSRKDSIGKETLTTFDIRMKKPNREMVLDTSVIHSIEHLMATFFRSHPTWAEDTIYIGPMGCRTGMYAIFKGNLSSEDVVEVLRSCYEYMAEYSDTIPATEAIMCGNYLDHNLEITKIECKIFLEQTLCSMSEENMVYPTQ